MVRSRRVIALSIWIRFASGIVRSFWRESVVLCLSGIRRERVHVEQWTQRTVPLTRGLLVQWWLETIHVPT